MKAIPLIIAAVLIGTAFYAAGWISGKFHTLQNQHPHILCEEIVTMQVDGHVYHYFVE